MKPCVNTKDEMLMEKNARSSRRRSFNSLGQPYINQDINTVSSNAYQETSYRHATSPQSRMKQKQRTLTLQNRKNNSCKGKPYEAHEGLPSVSYTAISWGNDEMKLQIRAWKYDDVPRDLSCETWVSVTLDGSRNLMLQSWMMLRQSSMSYKYMPILECEYPHYQFVK